MFFLNVPSLQSSLVQQLFLEASNTMKKQESSTLQKLHKPLLSKIRLPGFPEYNDRERCFVTLSNGDILSCGGKSKKCFVLANQGWIEHSTLDKDRSGAIGIQMPDGIYLFGGIQSPYTSHFLPNNTSVWQKGPEIPYINGSLISFGSNFWKRIAWVIFPCDYKANGHAISETELILIQEDCIITVHI